MSVWAARSAPSRAICQMWGASGMIWAETQSHHNKHDAYFEEWLKRHDAKCCHRSAGELVAEVVIPTLSWQVAGWRHQETRWEDRQGYNNTSVLYTHTPEPSWGKSTVDNLQQAFIMMQMQIALHHWFICDIWKSQHEDRHWAPVSVQSPVWWRVSTGARWLWSPESDQRQRSVTRTPVMSTPDRCQGTRAGLHWVTLSNQ